MKKLFVFVLIAMILLAAQADFSLLQQKVHDEDDVSGCCDNCGECDLGDIAVARCKCRDLVSTCRPGCTQCVEVSSGIDDGRPFYSCDDMSFQNCQRRCSTLVN